MRLPLSEQQAPAIWQNAPPQARRAFLIVARQLAKVAAERLKAEQEAIQDGDRSGER